MSAPAPATLFVPADVDECHRVPPPCDRGRCENTPGSFLCVCPAGYQAAPHGASCQGEGLGMYRGREEQQRCGILSQSQEAEGS